MVRSPNRDYGEYIAALDTEMGNLTPGGTLSSGTITQETSEMHATKPI